MALHKLPYAHLKDAPFTPRTLWSVQRNPCVFDDIREQDYLVHHPFDSLVPVGQVLQAAVHRPQRWSASRRRCIGSGENSPLIDSAARSHGHGKQVAVLVELKARLRRAEQHRVGDALEKAGVHVVYGAGDRRPTANVAWSSAEADGLRRYVHIGTGSTTAHRPLYEDYALLTGRPEMSLDDVAVLRSTSSPATRHGKLTFRPACSSRRSLRQRPARRARRARDRARQASLPARVIVKSNDFTDVRIALRRCIRRRSRRRIDLIVRGTCCPSAPASPA